MEDESPQTLDFQTDGTLNKFTLWKLSNPERNGTAEVLIPLTFADAFG